MDRLVGATVRGAREGCCDDSAVWLRRLTHEVARSEPSGGLDSLIGVLARAAGSCGAILWEASETELDPAGPAIAGAWFADGVTIVDPACPDPITMEAFTDHTLVMAAGARDRRGSPPAVIAALPLEYLDGRRGALTLLGDDELTGNSFDLTVDLLDVLPALCVLVRERRCLALVRRCSDILQDAEVESARQGPGGGDSGDHLGDHLGRVCTVIGDTLRCGKVSIFLREPGAPDGVFPLVASSVGGTAPGVPARSGIGLVGRVIECGRPLVAPAGLAGEGSCRGAEMAVPLLDGDQVSGAIACRGLPGPPFHFTRSDLSALGLIAPHVTRYWRNWLHRRAISVENRSWLLLAAGITAFNKLASEQLARTDPDDQRIYRAAMQIVRDVVPDCVGCDVYRSDAHRPDRHRARGASSAEQRLWPAESFPGAGGAEPEASMEFALSVLRSGRPGAMASPAGAAGWLAGTPIQVSGQVYGVLVAFGRCSTVPSNALQVGEIVGDQLGLYLHLRQTLQRLQETRGKLQATLRSQAEALEDLEHQLGGPLLVATERVDLTLQHGRFDGRTDAQLRAVRGLCRKAARVAMSAAVFAALSKGAAPRPRFELLSVDDLLRLLISGADDAQLLSNPRRRIRFEVEREGIRILNRRLIQADRSFVEQCVGNLLDNAAKYSYEDTAVRIHGSVDDEGFAVRVTSTGLPVDPADAKLCLRRNWRGSVARTTTGEGSGLGLWIVDHLMRSMKGAVRVQPVQDTTTVLLTFPIA